MGLCLGVLALIFVGITAPACYNPPKPPCGFICGSGGACPADYTCQADHRCHLNGTSEICAMVDAAIPDQAIKDSGGSDAASDAAIDAQMADTAIDGDTVAPTLASSTPANGDTNVSTASTIVVVFSEPVKNVGTTSFTVAGASAITGTITSMGGGMTDTTWTFTPSAALPAATAITVTLTTAITDASGNPLATTTFSFTTA